MIAFIWSDFQGEDKENIVKNNWLRAYKNKLMRNFFLKIIERLFDYYDIQPQANKKLKRFILK